MHYTFQASGSLWRDALVMQDLETKSLWSQISGKCIQGPSEGKQLTVFNSSHTTFSEYKKNYPNGLLLAKPEMGEVGSVYESYFADSAKMGIFGRVEKFERLAPKTKIFGVRIDNHQSAVSLEYMADNGYVILSMPSGPVIMGYDQQSETVIAFKLNGINQADIDKLVIADSKISLKNGSISWDLFTGKLLSSTGESLEAVPVITAFWFAWASFFPSSELVK